MQTITSSSLASSSSKLSPLVMIGLLAGPFLSMLDSNVVNVALPAIAQALRTDLASVQWVISGYLLALAVGLPASSFLAKRYGTRRIYMLSILGFTLSSLSCAFAPNLAVLVMMRAVQGACGAPLVPLAMNVLLGPQGAARDGSIPPAAGMLLFLAPALGPTVGGLLLRAGDWPIIFLINVPVGLLGFLGARRLSDDATGRGDHSARFDPFGLILLGGGLALATYGATEGAQQGWLVDSIWPFWATGAAFLIIYIFYALIRPHPAVDLSLLRHASSAIAVLIASLAAVVMFSMLFLIPIYLQQLQGASPLVAGLVLLPQGLITGLGALLGSAVSQRVGTRWCVVLGMAILAASTALLLMLAIDTPAWLTAVLLSGRGLATGLAIQPLLFLMMNGLNPRELPDGNTLFNVAERLSGSVGIALLATFFQQRELDRVAVVLDRYHLSLGALNGSGSASLPPALQQALTQAAMEGLHDTIVVLVVAALVGCLVALLIRESPKDSARQPVLAE